MIKKVELLLIGFILSQCTCVFCQNTEQTGNVSTVSLLEVIPDSARNISSFIPLGWKKIDSVNNDFNNDNLLDQAFVIEKIVPDTIETNLDKSLFFSKCLIVVLSSTSGTYHTSIKTSRLFGNTNWGLQGGDAFSKIDTNNRDLVLEFFSGGMLRIILSFKAQLIDNIWYFIGYTHTEFEVPLISFSVWNFNLQSGMNEKYVLKNNVISNKNISYSEVKPLLKLIDLDASNWPINYW